MRLPSLGYIAGAARASFARFPLMLTCALVAAACAVTSVEMDGDDSAFVNLMATAHLGIALFFALTAAAETGSRWVCTTRRFQTGFHPPRDASCNWIWEFSFCARSCPSRAAITTDSGSTIARCFFVS